MIASVHTNFCGVSSCAEVGGMAACHGGKPKVPPLGGGGGGGSGELALGTATAENPIGIGGGGGLGDAALQQAL